VRVGVLGRRLATDRWGERGAQLPIRHCPPTQGGSRALAHSAVFTATRVYCHERVDGLGRRGRLSGSGDQVQGGEIARVCRQVGIVIDIEGVAWAGSCAHPTRTGSPRSSPHPLPLTYLTLAFVVDSILKRKGHCVVCVAEGAGQDILDGSIATDLSGNPVLGDIGTHLRDLFRREFKGKDVKYIDPSYMIRSIPTITTDRKVYWPRPPRARPDSLTRYALVRSPGYTARCWARRECTAPWRATRTSPWVWSTRTM